MMKRTYAYVEVLVYVLRQVDVSPLSHSERTHLPLLTLVLLAGKASSLSAVGTTRTLSSRRSLLEASACTSVTPLGRVVAT